MKSIYLFIFFCCSEPPKELPPSRLKVASQSMMIQYGKLTAFLIERGKPQKTILWKVDSFTDEIKICAQKQTPMNSKVLVIKDQTELARSYLKIDVQPTPLQCKK